MNGCLSHKWVYMMSKKGEETWRSAPYLYGFPDLNTYGLLQIRIWDTRELVSFLIINCQLIINEKTKANIKCKLEVLLVYFISLFVPSIFVTLLNSFKAMSYSTCILYSIYRMVLESIKWFNNNIYACDNSINLS